MVGHATDDVGHTQIFAVLDQLNGILRHLLGQFTGGAQHQGTGHGRLEIARLHGVFALGTLGGGLAAGSRLGTLALKFGLLGSGFDGFLCDQGIEHGQQESSRFARAGLAGHHQVDAGFVGLATAHGQGNDFGLHFGGLGVAQIGDSTNQCGIQAQSDKGVGAFGHSGHRRGSRFNNHGRSRHGHVSHDGLV